MHTFKRLILFLILLAVIGVVCAHWLVRSSMGVSCIERRIKVATGLDAQVASVRLGLGMGLTILDLRLSLKDETDGEQTVLSTPILEVSRLGGKRGIRMARPIFTVVQSSRGNWTPSQLKDFVETSSFWSSLSKLAGMLDLRVEITDAAMVLKDSEGKELATYSGLSWYHSPVQMKGHSRMFHDVVSLQCINGEPVELSGEWLSDGMGMYFIGPVPVEMIADGGASEVEVEAAEPVMASEVEAVREVATQIEKAPEVLEVVASVAEAPPVPKAEVPIAEVPKAEVPIAEKADDAKSVDGAAEEKDLKVE